MSKELYKKTGEFSIRKIMPEDDLFIAKIVRLNLESHNLDVPGTAYFDPELDNLSVHYGAKPEERAYFIAVDDEGRVCGGVGFGRFSGFDECAEIQKLYVKESVKRRGLGRALMAVAEEQAGLHGYKQLYLETHTNLGEAITLYEKIGYKRIEKPEAVYHGTMNRFYLKKI